MSTFTETIDVQVPVRTAYDQWTQFETFPKFMSQVESVQQLDDETLRWKIKTAGIEREFLADIKTQTPDKAIAWQAQGDTQHAGQVRFDPIDATSTKVSLEMHVEPDDWVEKTADTLNAYDLMVKRDLESFKSFIEDRGVATGSWRGSIDDTVTSS